MIKTAKRTREKYRHDREGSFERDQVLMKTSTGLKRSVTRMGLVLVTLGLFSAGRFPANQAGSVWPCGLTIGSCATSA